MTERSIPHIRDIFGEEPRDSGMGSSQEEPQEETRRKKTRSRKSEEEVKHLERHLSMKKTIRKKMMRDLQQALVGDPEEAKEGDITSLHFAAARKKREEGFLDFLKSGGKPKADKEDEMQNLDKDDEKKGFWSRFTMRRNKR